MRSNEPRKARSERTRTVSKTTIRRLTGAMAVCVIGMLGFSTTPALAARNHVFSETIGSQGHGAGELELVAPVVENPSEPRGDITGGSGVAVNDRTGDI
jgi:hypothetical protein